MEQSGLSELGEFGLIEAITARLPRGGQVLLGPGDDAALVRVPDGRVVASTDALVEGRHFRRDWSTAYDVGRKAAAQNLADVVAMGARPTALLVALVLPAALPASWPIQLADGLRDECDLVGASVVGGDLVGGDAVTVAVTALGDLGGRPPMPRAGARPGDVVALAGQVGASAAGLALLSAGRLAPADLVQAHLRPSPPYQQGIEAGGLGAHAMIDISDGLVADLAHLAEASGVRVEVRSAAVRAASAWAELSRCAGELGVEPMDWVLGGGEDHALAATFPPDAALPPPWRVIGSVSQGSGVLVDGARWAGAPGWSHFSAPASGALDQPDHP